MRWSLSGGEMSYILFTARLDMKRWGTRCCSWFREERVWMLYSSNKWVIVLEIGTGELRG